MTGKSNSKQQENWLVESLRAQAGRDRELKATLSEDTASVRKQKRALASVLDMSDLPEPDDEEPIPDLFAEERASAEREKVGLSDFGADADSRRKSDLDLARSMFGEPPNKKKKAR